MSGLVFGVSGLVFGMSGLVFLMSGLVFWVSGLVFWVFGLYLGCLGLNFECLYTCRVWLWQARSIFLIDADDADDDGEPTTSMPHRHQQANIHRDQIYRSGDIPSL